MCIPTFCNNNNTKCAVFPRGVDFGGNDHPVLILDPPWNSLRNANITSITWDVHPIFKKFPPCFQSYGKPCKCVANTVHNTEWAMDWPSSHTRVRIRLRSQIEHIFRHNSKRFQRFFIFFCAVLESTHRIEICSKMISCDAIIRFETTRSTYCWFFWNYFVFSS